jgi:hypothetical protein
MLIGPTGPVGVRARAGWGIGHGTVVRYLLRGLTSDVGLGGFLYFDDGAGSGVQPRTFGNMLCWSAGLRSTADVELREEMDWDGGIEGRDGMG